MPMRSEILAPTIRGNPFLQVRQQRKSPSVSEIVFSSDFIAVAAFSAIALLASFLPNAVSPVLAMIFAALLGQLSCR